ncbi:MAG: hypothetical protein V3T23_01760 [Nitrososphaerales archaeon]
MTNSMIHETLKEHLEIVENLELREIPFECNRPQWDSIIRVVELSRTIVAENLLKEDPDGL